MQTRRGAGGKRESGGGVVLAGVQARAPVLEPRLAAVLRGEAGQEVGQCLHEGGEVLGQRGVEAGPARALSWATRASVWRVDRPTGPCRAPRAKPACSMSQAADSFTRPSGCGHRGMRGSPARALTASAWAGSRIGLRKKEPQERRLGSRGGAGALDFLRGGVAAGP